TSPHVRSPPPRVRSDPSALRHTLQLPRRFIQQLGKLQILCFSYLSIRSLVEKLYISLIMRFATDISRDSFLRPSNDGRTLGESAIWRGRRPTDRPGHRLRVESARRWTNYG